MGGYKVGGQTDLFWGGIARRKKQQLGKRKKKVLTLWKYAKKRDKGGRRRPHGWLAGLRDQKDRLGSSKKGKCKGRTQGKKGEGNMKGPAEVLGRR